MYGLLIFVFLLILGYVAGSAAESRHYRSIEAREKQFSHLPAVTIAEISVDENKVQNAELVHGCVVVSIDYFKRFLAGLRNIVGGPVTSYETLMDRARREATLRMKAMATGATIIVNVRLETATIGKDDKRGTVGGVEVIAYGTALTMKS